SLAGHRAQKWAAGLLVLMAVAYDSMLVPVLLLPATVPIALTLVGVGLVRYHRHRARLAGGTAPASGARCQSLTTLSDTRAPATRTARRTCPQHVSARRVSLTQPPARSPGLR